MYGAPTWLATIMFFAVGALMVSGIKLPKNGLWQKLFGLFRLAFLVLVIFT
jgi:predicted membrane protein